MVWRKCCCQTAHSTQSNPLVHRSIALENSRWSIGFIRIELFKPPREEENKSCQATSNVDTTHYRYSHSNNHFFSDSMFICFSAFVQSANAIFTFEIFSFFADRIIFFFCLQIFFSYVDARHYALVPRQTHFSRANESNPECFYFRFSSMQVLFHSLVLTNGWEKCTCSRGAAESIFDDETSFVYFIVWWFSFFFFLLPAQSRNAAIDIFIFKRSLFLLRSIQSKANAKWKTFSA